MLNGKLLDDAFPINKVEVFFDNLDHSHFLGFTWQLVSQGQMPIGLNTNDSDFNQIGKTGGGKTISYTPAGTNKNGAVQSHTLTINEIPEHNHEVPAVGGSSSGIWGSSPTANTTGSFLTGTRGGGKGHTHNFTQPTFIGTAATLNKMPPYIVMAFWKRIA